MLLPSKYPPYVLQDVIALAKPSVKSTIIGLIRDSSEKIVYVQQCRSKEKSEQQRADTTCNPFLFETFWYHPQDFI